LRLPRRPPDRAQFAGAAAAAEEGIAAVGINPRYGRAGRHLDLFQHLSSLGIDPPEIALVPLPGAVPEFAVDPGYAGDEAVGLDGAFSVGNLMMVSVLLRVKPSGILGKYPNLAAYVARGEARPAYRRAFDAQLAFNTGKLPTA
jgi:hypothetical protein